MSSKQEIPSPSTLSLQSQTPMMRQYFEIKAEYPHAILFFRLGDFYEMFFEDAVVASKILGLTLTARNKNQENSVPLCGIPHHAADSYINKLVNHGKKVVICEQVEDPKQAKGIVKREVTQIISPGIVLNDKVLSAKSHNFMMALWWQKDSGFLCCVCDVSTGTLEYFSAKTNNELMEEISRLDIREIIYADAQKNFPALTDVLQKLPHTYHHFVSDIYFDSDFSTDLILKTFAVSHLSALALEQSFIAVFGGLLGYLQESKILSQNLLQQPQKRQNEKILSLDEVTIRNLELFKTVNDQHQQGTLLWHLDVCQTVLGSRKLAEFVRAPLISAGEIQQRLDAVEELIQRRQILDRLVLSLNRVADLERLANKFIVQSANARDALALKESLIALPEIKEIIQKLKSDLFHSLSQDLVLLNDLSDLIHQTLLDEVPLGLKDGGMIRSGINAELDELRDIEKNGKIYIAQLEEKEKIKTKIASLKIRYNNVFGYYIEITHAHLDKVPSHYIRKQTLTQAERYITQELKDYENKVLGASERLKTLEYDIFTQLRLRIIESVGVIKKNAQVIAIADVLQAFATVSLKFSYVKPTVNQGLVLDLKEAKHPVLSQLVSQEKFISNDVYLETPHHCQIIITGPNMAGKSTVMRMTALIVVMAQMGCFVPCAEAVIGVCDRIFTRVGAHDHLQKGLSTFMVEMIETAKILREATPRSLVLLDEIGRGTSTFDGLSIAWSVAEDLHDRLACRTLFATHYHELCDLAETRKGIHNYHVMVKEWNDEIIFLRKLAKGSTNRSYGVAVASMAGLSASVIKRAKEILKFLELKDISFQSDVLSKNEPQKSLFDLSWQNKKGESHSQNIIFEKLAEINLDVLSPLEALNILAELKKIIHDSP